MVSPPAPASNSASATTRDASGLYRLTPAAQLRAGKTARRLIQLSIGLVLYALSMALIMRSGLGMLPWDVLHYGLARHLPLSLGTVVVLTSLTVLLTWIPIRQMPGIGTIANAVFIGLLLDPVLRYLPVPEALWLRILFLLAGVVINAVATASYIGSHFGPGPRDGLMTGLARATGRSLRLVRTGIEVTVVGVGWLLGGVVGFGTLLYALAIGPLTQFFLPRLSVRLEPRGPKSTG